MKAPGDRRSDILAFAGPSCAALMRARYPAVEWRPPAVAGDMLRLLAGPPPRCVAIIDGLFDQQPAVRHKEILLLLAEGVPVVGAASMGALRGAELAAFGMVGVGRVHQAYVRGTITGDDEVALMHGPEAYGWAPLTVALVNVRATLVSAVRARVLGAAAARAMLRLSAEMFYQHRTWEALAIAWMQDGWTPAVLDPFLSWLPRGYVDLKALDAEEGLRTALRLAHQAPCPRPAPPDTLFTQALSRALWSGEGAQDKV